MPARSGNRSADGNIPALVNGVCRRIPPLWDLTNYVAVNPFLGFAEQSVVETARTLIEGLDADLAPPLAYYQQRWSAGAFDENDLAVAASRTGQSVAELRAILTGSMSMPRRSATRVLCLAERYDQIHGTQLHLAMLRWLTRWLPTYVARGGMHWAGNESRGLFAAWHEAAQQDGQPLLLGLKRWGTYLSSLPRTPLAAIETLLHRLPIAPRLREPYLYRLLGSLYGWSSYLRRESWQSGNEPGPLGDLLAIRLTCDAAVKELLISESASEELESLTDTLEVEEESVRLAFQEALEHAYLRRLRPQVIQPTLPPQERPKVQGVFCIDVRSEVLRRHLEACSAEIETAGFAGFFGVSLQWQDSARCPVLLQPAVSVCCDHGPVERPATHAAKHVQQAGASAYTFVETLGLTYAWGLLRDAFQAGPAVESDGREPFHWENPREQLATAAGIVKNLGLRTWARVVLLCGHEGHSANNPHAAGLDCGACGGHGGAINARAAAALLNDAEVRRGLAEQGTPLPDDTVFVAGVHDTTTDRVTLFDTASLPASHQGDLNTLRDWLAQAGEAARRERSESLGLQDQPTHWLESLLTLRSRDIAEVRPEWALARNAAFIAARRCRTRGANLAGRSFLHEYDAARDADSSILTLILRAPMVVASWINLQYLASTVDNVHLGAGNKTIHNRIGRIGVVQGNGGDLCTGLPLQSVHAPDGSWYHEPLRLQVIVEAPEAKIDAILAIAPEVRALVENGWVRLHALSPESERLSLRTAQGWQEV
jgi:hypothetical protein